VEHLGEQRERIPFAAINICQLKHTSVKGFCPLDGFFGRDHWRYPDSYCF